MEDEQWQRVQQGREVNGDEHVNAEGSSEAVNRSIHHLRPDSSDTSSEGQVDLGNLPVVNDR